MRNGLIAALTVAAALHSASTGARAQVVVSRVAPASRGVYLGTVPSGTYYNAPYLNDPVYPYSTSYISQTAYYGYSPAINSYYGYYPAPYSYYAAPYPFPARLYVGYGNDFPFYGRPYGHPSDRWSWSSMGASYRVR
jgi:hypothetical protein